MEASLHLRALSLSASEADKKKHYLPQDTQGDTRPAHNAQTRGCHPSGHLHYTVSTTLHLLGKNNVRAEDPQNEVPVTPPLLWLHSLREGLSMHPRTSTSVPSLS